VITNRGVREEREMTSVSLNTDPTEFDPDMKQSLPWSGADLPLSFPVISAFSFVSHDYLPGGWDWEGEWSHISFEPVFFLGGNRGINFAR